MRDAKIKQRHMGEPPTRCVAFHHDLKLVGSDPQTRQEWPPEVTSSRVRRTSLCRRAGSRTSRAFRDLALSRPNNRARSNAQVACRGSVVQDRVGAVRTCPSRTLDETRPRIVPSRKPHPAQVGFARREHAESPHDSVAICNHDLLGVATARKIARPARDPQHHTVAGVGRLRPRHLSLAPILARKQGFRPMADPASERAARRTSSYRQRATLRRLGTHVLVRESAWFAPSRPSEFRADAWYSRSPGERCGFADHDVPAKGGEAAPP